MRVSTEGRSLIKSHEGLRLRAYLCPAGVWTIGYGSTGKHVYKGKVITRAEAEALLIKDLDRFERGVMAAVRPAAPNQAEFDAMVSLAFNIGLGNFGKSSVVRNFRRGDKIKAAESFALWNKARNPRTGKLEPLPGLTRRRAEEKQLFLSGANERKVTRSTGAKQVSVPEASVVPEAPKSLGKSREIIGGGVVGLGGVSQMLSSFTTSDAQEVKHGVEMIKHEADTPLVQQLYIPEIASAAAVGLSMFIIWKRLKDRKDGVR